MTWDGRIISDARRIPLANESVQLVVTSPPYWKLRDYAHPEQIGLEPTPEAYVESIRSVFWEIWRVLKPDGLVFLNLGDTFVEKSLAGIPWAVAFALRGDDWYLRRDIIWSKTNPMPESAADRCTSSHEYIFMFSKNAEYYYDAAAIAEPARYGVPNSPQSISSPHGQGFTRRADSWNGSSFNKGKTAVNGNGRNQSEDSRARTDKQSGHGRRHTGFNARFDETVAENGYPETRNKRSVWTISTQPYPEAHYATFPEEIPEICIKAGSRPGDLVLDPFLGSGTVARVAERLSRRWVGCDLGYMHLSAKRMANLQKDLLL